MKPCPESFVQLFHLPFQDGSEERSGHNGSLQLACVLRRVSCEALQEGAEFIAEGAHHAYAVFDLRIIAVMLLPRYRAAGAKIDLVAQECEGSAQPPVQLPLNLRNCID